ncbi:antitoxin [Actinacidiphila oryziradicis]|jgi:hypothetical protein|uniref:Antitoxin n=1 Tax=Actinacidiphila oryziradicis TaxID=2571141 RepID=A0A4U0SLW8_9ACTN|nr:antitoxin [Actinacidiphila oryziradicis]TKA10884.1 antitoxin [Actinacidiphila oryziradicis]
MSMLDKIKDMIKGHPHQTRQGVEKAGDMTDKKTGDKYTHQVDTGQQKLNEQFGNDEKPPHT